MEQTTLLGWPVMCGLGIHKTLIAYAIYANIHSEGMAVSKRVELALKNLERALEADFEEGLISVREAFNINASLAEIKRELRK